jgi:hypothetical protein
MEDEIKFELDKKTGIYTSSRPVQKLQEFIELTTGLSRHSTSRFTRRPILFRGHKEASWPLLPSISRTEHFKPGLLHEKSVFEDFKRQCAPFLPRFTPELSDLEYLAVAQHYGLATRLLDWTENALAALWFTVEEYYTPQQKASTPTPLGATWVYLPDDDDFLMPKEHAKDPFSFKGTKVFRPNHIADRIRVQAGWFTVHWWNQADKRFIAMDRRRSCKDNLRKILVDGRWFSKLLKQLTDCGITSAVLFPDLEGLASHLNRTIRYLRNGGF